MRRSEATAWVISVCACTLRLSQAKTLAAPVGAAMGVRRATLANLGRQMFGRAKHQIKRAWRFTDNDRVEVSDAPCGRSSAGCSRSGGASCWSPWTGST